MPAALELRGVSKRYGNRTVLDAVDLTIGQGETVALLGANGAGKTTLLRIAATLARPDAGTVLVAGVDAGREPEAARLQLGVLLQETPLYPELTPAEHLQFWQRVRGLGSVDVEATLVDAGLSKAAHQQVATQSKGMRQRLGLALATLGDPAVLLLDEPFAALDPDGQAALERKIDARRGRTATLVVLQDLPHARAIADRVLRLRNHRLEAAP
jgi:ABC-type multidrug transport system ATPase subunit